jgi:hypothetical protein
MSDLVTSFGRLLYPGAKLTAAEVTRRAASNFGATRQATIALIETIENTKLRATLRKSLRAAVQQTHR